MTNITLHQTDLVIFQALARLHYLTAEQLSRLLERPLRGLQRRLTELREDRYLGCHAATNKSQPHVWFCRPGAHQALVDAGLIESSLLRDVGIRADPRGNHWAHDMELNDALITLLLLLPDTRIAKGLGTSTRIGDLVVEPDALLQHHKLGFLFWEHDRGSKPLYRRKGKQYQSQDVSTQLAAYRLFLKEGLFTQHYHADAFHVAITVPDATRRTALLGVVYDHPSLYLVSIYQDALRDPSGAVWIHAGDPVLIETLRFFRQHKGQKLGESLPPHCDDIRHQLDKKLLSRKPVLANNRFNTEVVNAVIECMVDTGRLSPRSLVDNSQPTNQDCDEKELS